MEIISMAEITNPTSNHKSPKVRPRPGDFFCLKLQDGRYGFGRVYAETLGFYDMISDHVLRPEELGASRILFNIAVSFDVLESGEWPIIGHEPFRNPDEAWVPCYIVDALTGEQRFYYKGKIRSATKSECEGLEQCIAWAPQDAIERLARELGLPLPKWNREDNRVESLAARVLEDDLGYEVAQSYRSHREGGASPVAAGEFTLREFTESLTDPDERSSIYLALAYLQLQDGQVNPVIRQRALEIVDKGEGLDSWKDGGAKLLRERVATMRALAEALRNG